MPKTKSSNTPENAIGAPVSGRLANDRKGTRLTVIKTKTVVKAALKTLSSKVLCVMGACLLAGPAAQAQGTTLKVRLYTLHQEHHLKLTAISETLTWKTCAKCAAHSAKELLVEAAPQGLKIGDAGQNEFHPRLLVSGSYRIDPESGLKSILQAPIQIQASNGLLTVVAEMPLEDYVTAALMGENGASASLESLKAMAVAIRTYAARFRPRHQTHRAGPDNAGRDNEGLDNDNAGFDFCDNTHCQTLNLTGTNAPVRAAVQATAGQLLWYKSNPIAAYYHQNCGGNLAAAQEAWPDLHEPYLQQRSDPYCQRHPLLWKAVFPRDRLVEALRSQQLSIPANWTRLEVLSRSPSGRVLKLTFVSSAGPAQSISASSLRFAIGRSLGWNHVRSDLYQVQTTGDSVIFAGKGSGHGVGLCQEGAEEMAAQGRTYKEILEFYFPGTSLGTTATGLAWQTREGTNFELMGTQPAEDAAVLQAAETLLPSLEAELGWKLEAKTRLKVFPTLDAYRNSTGQPGWIAAYTRGNVISLQPRSVLEEKSALQSTLRHELLHLLVESRAHSGTPVWFREGLVLYLADPQGNFEPVIMDVAQIEAGLQHSSLQQLEDPQNRRKLERAYSAARTKVVQLVRQNGRATVLQWLSSGLPGSGFSSPSGYTPGQSHERMVDRLCRLEIYPTARSPSILNNQAGHEAGATVEE
ncbi:MAG TPA: SpoIID/LytB domain-containing protein [Candidatus Angelobacter sp.]|nr:SpoIID/LytB domain-containing protein [Candidatus Angelobacter sp.]